MGRRVLWWAVAVAVAVGVVLLSGGPVAAVMQWAFAGYLGWRAAPGVLGDIRRLSALRNGLSHAGPSLGVRRLQRVRGDRL